MKLIMPEYYKEFRCIADKCTDSCCIGWEIDIDANTADFYETVSGDFGLRLKKNITSSSAKSFILAENERCPFLNDRNLCDIIINLGEDKRCAICTDHPRYFEWFNGVNEGGIGLCCEEAARIILTRSQPFSCYATEIEDNTVADTYDTELYDYLSTTRNQIIAHLENKKIPLTQCICDILTYSEKLQYRADNYDYSIPEIESCQFGEKSNIRPVFELFLELEPIDNEWFPYLNDCINRLESSSVRLPEFLYNNRQCEQYLRNIAIYFVWRYLLKGVFDGEFLSKVKLMTLSVAIIGWQFMLFSRDTSPITAEKCIEITKNYSKEIEYSEENLEFLADESYLRSTLSADAIVGLFR